MHETVTGEDILYETINSPRQYELPLNKTQCAVTARRLRLIGIKKPLWEN